MLELGLWKMLDKDLEVEDADFERVKRGALQLTMKLDGFVLSFAFFPSLPFFFTFS